MSFIAKIFGMDPPEMEAPKTDDVPSLEDEQRELEQRRLLEEQEKRRRGRRSTILTGGEGLNDIEDENINQKTLLGE
jgi:hypothetical protein